MYKRIPGIHVWSFTLEQRILCFVGFCDCLPRYHHILLWEIIICHLKSHPYTGCWGNTWAGQSHPFLSAIPHTLSHTSTNEHILATLFPIASSVYTCMDANTNNHIRASARFATDVKQGCTPPPPLGRHRFTEVTLGEHLSPSTTASTRPQAPVSLWSPPLLYSGLCFLS